MTLTVHRVVAVVVYCEFKSSKRWRHVLFGLRPMNYRKLPTTEEIE